MIPLVENVVLEWVVEEKEQTFAERVLYVDRPAGQIVVIALFGKSLPIWKCLEDVADAIAVGRAFRRPDPYAHYANPDLEYVTSHADRRDRAWEIIKDLVAQEPDIYRSDQRGCLIKDAEEKFQTHKSEIYRLLKRYWVGGKIKNALLPDYDRCGGVGKTRVIEAVDGKKSAKRGRPSKESRLNPDHAGVNVDTGILGCFDLSIKLFYDRQGAPTLRDAYNKMLDRFFSAGTTVRNGVNVPVLRPSWEVPSFEQFQYWHEKRQDLSHSLIKRQGQKKYELRNRPILGSSTLQAFGPGSIYQIDATIADVYLVSRFNRAWIIGRPVVYFIMDVFSHLCAGVYVGLEGPSWAGAMMAIANAATDKVAYCAEYGIPIQSNEWPARYLPAKILADRGEMIGWNADNLPDALDITVENCPPYRGDLKGLVEQQFHRANCKSVRWLPGYVTKDSERGDKDYRLDAILDIWQFTRVIIHTVLAYNKSHWIDKYESAKDIIRDDVHPIPLQLWEWGVKHRVGHLRERSPEVIKLGLMPKGEATVTEAGIRFKGAFYDTERALREQWYVRARTNGRWNIPISYDPRNTDVIYWHTNGNPIFEPCNLLDRNSKFKGCSIEEIEQGIEIEKLEAGRHESTERQANAELRAFTDQTIMEAHQMTKAACPQLATKAARLEGIKRNRKNEKELNRVREGFDLRPPRAKKGLATVHALKPKHNSDDEDDTTVVTSAERSRRLLNILEDEAGT
jgi:putative transposase